jgi:hypothetical protein
MSWGEVSDAEETLRKYGAKHKGARKTTPKSAGKVKGSV